MNPIFKYLVTFHDDEGNYAREIYETEKHLQGIIREVRRKNPHRAIASIKCLNTKDYPNYCLDRKIVTNGQQKFIYAGSNDETR